MGVVVVLTLLAAQAGPPPPQAEPPRDARIELAAPPFELPPSLRDSIRFGYIEVPQDHDDPASRTLRLAFSVLPARAAEPAPDPIIFIPGGPGMSAVGPWTADAARSARIALLRERRDFIILDPRGHGLSEPRTCPELDGAAPLTSDSPAAETILVSKLSACRARLLADGARPELLDAVQAARDIDVLRRGLGVERVNLLGASYGSRIAAEAMRRIPSAIRAVVMIGPVPPGLPHLGDDADVAGALFTALFRRCAQLDACSATYPRLAEDYDSVMARARRSPVRVPVPTSDRAPEGWILLDDRALNEGLAQLLTARSLAAGAPLMIQTIARHGFDPVVGMAPQLLTLFADDDIAFGTNLAFHCNDSPVSLETAPWLRTRCPAWVGESYGDAAGEPLRADIPSLIMVGELDPRTPPRYARFLASGLTRARVLEIPWHGHEYQSPCMSRIQRDFFDSPHLAPDAACLDSIAPIPFARRVVLSRWIGRAVMRANAAPFRAAAPAAAAVLLLLLPVTLLPIRELRGQRTEHRRAPLGAIAIWLAAATALIFLVGVMAAIVIGARTNVLVPALGVPAGWAWVVVLPWVLCVLTIAAAALASRGNRQGDRFSAYLRYSGLIGSVLVLGLWAYHSLV
ncbi:MAG TPA: alpha/beta fold hydrolase [Longimicrobiales bacterium]